MSGFDKEKTMYYRSGRRYEPINVIRDWDLNFNLGNVVKYISRDGRKESDNGIDNLKKAADYLAHEIHHREMELKRNESKPPEPSNSADYKTNYKWPPAYPPNHYLSQEEPCICNRSRKDTLCC